jgi:hypothetical protein
MDSIDLERLERRARLKYEWSRARWAFFGFAPAMLVVGIAVQFARNPSSTAWFGLLMFVVGVSLLWYGRDLKRAVLPGLVAGIVPLTLVLCANHVGHACMGDECMMVCLPACAGGGIVAGLVVAAVGYRRGHGAGFWVGASAVALLTGAMGCICVGYSGLGGLALGYGAGIVPAAARRLFARGSS